MPLRRRARALAAVPLAALAALTALAIAPVQARADDSPHAQTIARDGSSAATAAASCWQIKRDSPQSPSGAYWLQTPTMKAPQQFFCDQTTDGGGWVLIGRGREGWETWTQGKGDPAALTRRERTPADFGTVQLSTETVNGLLGGGAVSSLNEGLRVVRAQDSRGSSWQTVDMVLPKMKDFVWPFKSAHPVKYRYNNRGYWYEGRIWDTFGSDQSFNGVNMTTSTARSGILGFAYGKYASARGWWSDTSSNTTFLYNVGRALMPYAEAYIRPQISSDDPGFQRIADSGTPATTVTAAVSEFAAPSEWGVSGNLNGSVAEGSIQVQAFEEIGSTMFVGGNFTGVKKGEKGRETRSSGLAAFDVATGAWNGSMTWEFNNQVKDLVELPNGRLLVVGDFTTVNGESHRGTVLIDPATGAIDPAWDLQIVNNLSSGRISVKSASVSGDYIYLGGSFTHLSGQGANKVYGRNAARVSLTGKPDRSWNPEFNGAVLAGTADPEQSYYYAAGHFTRSINTTAKNATRVSTEAGARVDTSFSFVPSYHRGTYQQDVKVFGDRVYFGGAQHSLFGYTRSDMRRVSGSITMNNGGDVQAITTAQNGVLYASCHCSDFSYEDATKFYFYDDFSRADEIRWVGAWDGATGKQIGWAPYRLNSTRSTGAWALETDSNGSLWAGGDFNRSFTSLTSNQWSGGFVRFPARDQSAPEAPSLVRSTASDAASITLAWNGVPDAAGYEILRDDRPVAVSKTTTAQVPRGGENRYFVRAVDAAGNRSASSPVYSAPAAGQADENNPVLVEDSAEWKYLWATDAVPADWNAPGFDDSAWTTGTAPIGYGDSGLGTVLTPGAAATRPVTTYFRKTISLDDRTRAGGISISYTADDGAVVYVNGREVSRTRIDDGPVAQGTHANAAVSASRARQDRTTVAVPSSGLVVGENVIAIETHLNYRGSKTMTMQATVSTAAPAALAAAQDDPSEPVEQDAAPSGEDSDEAADAEAPGAGRPQGQPLSAIDATGIASGDVVASGETWSYWVEKDAPAPDWTTTGDISGWRTGAGPIGWGHSSVVTALDIPRSDRAATSYFARDIDLGDLSDSAELTLSVRADDGAVVYVNGHEVGRQRLAEGKPVTHTTRATSSVNTRLAINAPLTITVPARYLVDGVNRIGVEEHVGYLSTPSMTFDLSASLSR
ncbi:galactose oxidase [Actinomyces sp. B33]|uniref:fibrinogen-like YCDxxxxGGGW domain-containing protein n=1 Tax=Actinomyces sp. B33 TaxID=2942131 RepID=UPI00234047E2|nr:fibrinogen-like YCDxxxxGGGW domain-containing protein [Actinomyces sp. B33]MDC4233605.1 galactose oxidase [Actinomyces sp. B33]